MLLFYRVLLLNQILRFIINPITLNIILMIRRGEKIMSSYQFKMITEDHIDTIREIYTYYIKNTTVTFHTREITKEEMANIVLFKNKKYESYLIESEEQICGYVILTQYKPREAFDQTAEISIYLKKGYEGRGIGKKALAFIEERARMKSIHTLISLICSENGASIALFERHGYEKCAHYKEVGYKFNRWLDLVAYQKILV